MLGHVKTHDRSFHARTQKKSAQVERAFWGGVLTQYQFFNALKKQNGMWSLPVASQPPCLGTACPQLSAGRPVSLSIYLALPSTTLTPCLSHLTHPAGPGSAPPPTMLAQILPPAELPQDRLNQVTDPTQLVQHDPEGSGWKHHPERDTFPTHSLTV